MLKSLSIPFDAPSVMTRYKRLLVYEELTLQPSERTAKRTDENQYLKKMVVVF